MPKTNIKTQQVINALLEFGKKYGYAPGNWRLMVAAIDDSETVQRQLLYQFFVRKEVLQSLGKHGMDVAADPDILLYVSSLKDFGINLQ